MKKIIQTNDAPAAIGAYSQAVCAADLVFISGQIPLTPGGGELVSEDAETQIRQAFANLAAVCKAAGGSSVNDGSVDGGSVNDDSASGSSANGSSASGSSASGSLDDIIKLTVYLTDLAHFPIVNAVMAELFCEPYPARAAIGVASLPKGALVEVEAILQRR